MSPPLDSSFSTRYGVAAGVTVLSLALGSCRGDSITTPGLQCIEATDCPAPRAFTAEMRDALEDTQLRLVPALGAGAARNAVETALLRLQVALDAQDRTAGRLALALSYEALTRLPADEGAEVSAIRLALAPLAGVLGVAEQAVP